MERRRLDDALESTGLSLFVRLPDRLRRLAVLPLEGTGASRGCSRSRSIRSARGCSSTRASPTARFIGDQLGERGQGEDRRRRARLRLRPPRATARPDARGPVRPGPTLEARPLVWRATLTELGPMVAMAGRSQVARDPARGGRSRSSSTNGDRVSARPGDPSRRLPVLDPAHELRGPVESSAISFIEKRSAPADQVVRPPAASTVVRRLQADRPRGDRLGDRNADRRVDRRDALAVRVKKGLRWWKLQANGDHLMSGRSTEATDSKLTRRPGWPRVRKGRSPPARCSCTRRRRPFRRRAAARTSLCRPAGFLEALGVPVRLFSPMDRPHPASPGCSTCSGCRVRGLSWPRRRRRDGVPVVVSPICWYEPAALSALEPALRRKAIAAVGRLRSPSRRSGRVGVAELLHLADRILPNSTAEADQLSGFSASTAGGSTSCPTACSPAFGSASPNDFREQVGELRFRPLGRSDRAAEEPTRSGPAVVELACPVVRGRRCRRIRGLRREFADAARRSRGLARGGSTTTTRCSVSAYAAARVFALPSWFETPGLAALEAALAGAPVVDHAESVRPANTSAISWSMPDRTGPEIDPPRCRDLAGIRTAIRAGAQRGRPLPLADVARDHGGGV